MSGTDSSEDSSDWEEVKEEDYDIPKICNEDPESIKEYTQNLNIPTEGIQITLEGTGNILGKKKREFDAAAYFRRRMNGRRKELQQYMHQAHLLCLLGRGLYVNKILKCEDILAVGFSVLPAQKSKAPKNIDLGYLESFIKWFKKTMSISDVPEKNSDSENLLSELEKELNDRVVKNAEHFVYSFIVILRSLSVTVRLVCSLQPLPLKPPASELLQDPEKKGRQKDAAKEEDQKFKREESPTTSKAVKKSAHSLHTPDKKSSKPKTKPTEPDPCRASQSKTPSKSNNNSRVPETSPIPVKKPEGRSSRAKRQKRDNASTLREGSENDSGFDIKEESQSDPDSDFDLNRSSSSTRRKRKVPPKSKPVSSKKKGNSSKKVIGKGRKMISSSEDETSTTVGTKSSNKKKRTATDTWAEVFLEEEERWVSVDILNGKIMCDSEFEPKATQPMAYVVAFDNDNRVKDVTRRYASKWMTATQKIRVQPKWWIKSLKPFTGRKTRRDREEDEYLDQHLMNQSIPSTVQEVKNHPLFAMQRHLLKFEALYPPDPQPLGFIKNEPVFPRECVKTLHSRELWLRQAKVVRLNEAPYKIVKARPKYDRGTGQVIKDRPLDLFGDWQVEDYVPPPAVDGKVPRNDYGNVELFMAKMLPKGTVHLQEPGLNRVAKKLNIDCAPAVVGFDYHSGGCHPTYDGFVVCEEYKDILLDALREDQEESLKRGEAKRSKRVRDTWRRIIRMVIIRRRLERKYDMFSTSTSATTSKRSVAANSAKPHPTVPKVNGNQKSRRGRGRRKK